MWSLNGHDVIFCGCDWLNISSSNHQYGLSRSSFCIGTTVQLRVHRDSIERQMQITSMKSQGDLRLEFRIILHVLTMRLAQKFPVFINFLNYGWPNLLPK